MSSRGPSDIPTTLQMSYNIGNNDSMAIREEAISNGAENDRDMRRRRRHPSTQHEAPTKRPRLSPDVLSVIPEWMRNKVIKLNFTDHPTMQPIIEIHLRHYDGDDEMDEDTTSNFNNEGDVVDERDELMEINHE